MTATTMPRRISARQAREFLRRAQANNIMSRLEFLQKAGVTYGGKRDVWETAGYEKQPSFAHFYSLYRRDPIAGRIVDMPAKTTWREPPWLVEEGEEATEFTDAFGKLAKKLNLWRYFERVDRLAGVGRYAVLLIGSRGGESLQTPLAKVQGSDSIAYLQVYSEQNAAIEKWVTSATDERFGQPELYKIRVTSVDSFKTREMLVHWTRVIHVAEDLLEDEVFGRPRLERVLNRLMDLDKVAASTGEAYWQAVVRILTANVDPGATMSPEDMKLLDERLLEVTHDLRRQVTAQGVDLSWLPSEIPSVKDIGGFYFSLIAAGSGIPQRILFGSEMGELASTTDQQTWFGLIDERQEQFAEPTILRAFVDRMIRLGALPGPETEGEYLVQWPSLFKETESAKADLNLKRAQQAQALTPVGGDPRQMVTIDDEGTVTLIPQDAEQAQELDA